MSWRDADPASPENLETTSEVAYAVFFGSHSLSTGRIMRIPLTHYGIKEMAAATVLCGAGGVVCLYFFWPGIVVFGIVWLWAMSFFRDPERPCEAGEHQLLCPADGCIQDIEEVDAPEYLEGRAVRVGIFMSIFNVHVNRSPAACEVEYVQPVEGTYHDARDPRSSTENAHVLTGVKLDDGRKLLVNQIAGAVARQIVCDVLPGDRLEKGQRLGMIKFGSRVEVFLPVKDPYEVTVEVGDKVKAGKHVIAEFTPDTKE